MHNLMPDISFLVEDEDLGAQPFTIIRMNGYWDHGDFIEKPESIPAFGNIQPASDHQINQVPEGDRTSGMISVRTTTPLWLASQDCPHHGADVIEWMGTRYKIVAITPWNQFGFTTATLARM